MLLTYLRLQDWGDFYDQGSSQSSGGAFSVGAPTPSPNPLITGNNTVVIKYEKEPSPPSTILSTSSPTDMSPYKLLNMEIYNSQGSPVKLIPLVDDLALNMYNSPGVNLLKNSEDKQLSRTSKNLRKKIISNCER